MTFGESITVLPEVVGEVLIFGEEIAGVQIRGWGAIVGTFSEILTKTGPEVEQSCATLEAR